MARKTNFTTKNGNDYFRIKRKVGTRINEHGAEVSVFKTFYGNCKAEADEKYQKFLADEKAAKEEAVRKEEEKKKKEEEMKMHPYGDKTLAEVIDKWIEQFFSHYDLADTTKVLYVESYQRYFKDTETAAMPFEAVTAGHLQDFFNNADVKYSALKAVHKLLNHFYQHIELTSYGAYHDVVRPVKLPKNKRPIKAEREIDVWEDSDLYKLIDFLDGNRYRFLVLLAVNTGLRVSEIRALHYSDIDSNGILTVDKQVTEVTFNGEKGIRIADTKTQSSIRTIPLPAEIIEELNKHKKLHKKEMRCNGYITDIIFSSTNGNYMYKATLDRQLKKIYKAAEVPAHPFHSFRKTYLTNQRRAGTDLETTSRLAGHSDVTVTAQYYINVDAEQKRQANSNILKFSLRESAV